MSVSSRRTNRTILIVVGFLLAGIVALAVRANQVPSDGPLKGKTAIVYRSASCGCCAQYISYLRRSGARVEEKLTNDMGAIRQQFGVPAGLSSCHTTRIEDYTVEGHIPVEAIQKLLAEKPAIAGIALPGMPSGSPGMPGAKYGAFEISSFASAGSSSLYMNL